MNYDIEKQELTFKIDGVLVKLTFESDTPETSIWHYVFSALTSDPHPPVHRADTPIE